MQTNRNNIRIFETQQTILAALFVILAFVGGCWFLSYRVYTAAPATEVIMVTLPPDMVSQPSGFDGGPEPVTVEVEREKPWRKDFSALLHPFGFMVLLLVIVGAGAGLILLVIYLDRGRTDG